MTPSGGNIAEDIASSNEYAVITKLNCKNSIGYGWLAGASFGIKISKIGMSLDFLYRNLQAPLERTGTYDHGTDSSSYTSGTINFPDAILIIRGCTIGIGGSYAFWFMCSRFLRVHERHFLFPVSL